MKMNCNIAEDLLPLYLEDSCSPDGRAALEAHLQQCPHCQAKLERMRREIGSYAQDSAPDLANLGKQLKKRRGRLVRIAISLILLSSLLLTLLCLTLMDMYRQAHPIIHETEPGTYNLTAQQLEIQANQAETYLFFTNTTKLQVQAQSEVSLQGKVLLWNGADDRDFIQIAEISQTFPSCTFANLSAANRYRVTFQGPEDTVLTISDGRRVSFFSSLSQVLKELLAALF